MTENNDKKTSQKSTGFSEMELGLMKERAQELKIEARVNKNREIGEKSVSAAIDVMSAEDAKIAKKIHEIVSKVSPSLLPRMWYGMPGYAKDGKVICFFQSASKFKVRYCTFGFQPDANLDEGNMWPTSFAIKEINETVEIKISELVKKAIS